jgi:hydroxymethylpyrimidine/phosphomethylpyrimidine kinase
MGAPPDIAPPRVLAIAGSDSGGGAGIQADLKAIAGSGAHGMTAITAITAQSTVGVRSVLPVPAEMVLDQVRAVVEDIGVDAVKIGMVGNAETIVAVGEALDLTAEAPVVLDPVMVAESGARLLDEEAEGALRELLLPRATVITPNLAEAAALAARAPASEEEEEEEEEEGLARALHRLGPEVVVVTGGHRAQATDVFYDGRRHELLHGERHTTGAAHGSGCTHSSSLAAALAHGLDPLAAARWARWAAGEAVRRGLRGIGAGAGPVDVLGVRERGPGIGERAPGGPERAPGHQHRLA